MCLEVHQDKGGLRLSHPSCLSIASLGKSEVSRKLWYNNILDMCSGNAARSGTCWFFNQLQ